MEEISPDCFIFNSKLKIFFNVKISLIINVVNNQIRLFLVRANYSRKLTIFLVILLLSIKLNDFRLRIIPFFSILDYILQ